MNRPRSVAVPALILALGLKAWPAGAAETGKPTVMVTDLEALAAAAAGGADFGALIDGAPGARNDVLVTKGGWRSIAEVIKADLAKVQRADPQAGVSVAGKIHRLFDARWLASKAAAFELIGVVNRIDRRAFRAGGCGETHLVYRLAYRKDDRGKPLASRLPMTVSVNFAAGEQKQADCGNMARRWVAPADARGAVLGKWLVSAEGPLAASELDRARLVEVRVNLQSVRWPSTVRPELGGHAEYLMRAFRFDAKRKIFVAAPLENSPDVARVKRDRALRRELLAWISNDQNLTRIDEGTAVIPEKFLAKESVSVTPRGLQRRANRPFRQIFDPKEIAKLELASRRLVRSPEALLRRLDDLTCAGCHQSRSIAGFHLLGEDPVDVAPGNALTMPISPHASREVARRSEFVRALLDGATAEDARPFAERAGAGDSGYGAACGLGDSGFAGWGCDPGLRCDAYGAPVGEQTVGVCLSEKPSIGDPCEAARVTSNPDGHKDRASKIEKRECPGAQAVCEATRVGFPGGMCAGSCEALPEGSTCGAIAILQQFNDCVAKKTPFSECITKHVTSRALRACSSSNPCRDDYVCAKTPAGDGACIPPYFMFQLRVDGHTL